MSSPAVLPRGARRALGRLDHTVYRAVRGRLHHAEITPRVAAFSRLGEHAGLWLGIGAAGFALDPARRDRWVRGLQLVAGAYVANTAVKNVIGRQRPTFEEFPHLVRTPTQLSFPSAHATSSFCAAAAYRGLLPAGPLYATATAMAASRVVLGVHFPSDIVAGAALGTLVGTLGRQSP